jgi:hypothetical protein
VTILFGPRERTTLVDGSCKEQRYRDMMFVDLVVACSIEECKDLSASSAHADSCRNVLRCFPRYTNKSSKLTRECRFLGILVKLFYGISQVDFMKNA